MTGITEWATELGEGIEVINNHCFSISRSYVKLRDLLDGKTIWSYKIKESDLVPYIAVVTDEYVVIGDKGNDLLVQLDWQTGVEIKIRTIIAGGIFEDGGELFQLMGSYSNLNNGQIIKNSEYYESVGMINQNDNLIKIYNHILYSSFNQHFGALNIEKGVIDWLFKD